MPRIEPFLKNDPFLGVVIWLPQLWNCMWLTDRAAAMLPAPRRWPAAAVASVPSRHIGDGTSKAAV